MHISHLFIDRQFDLLGDPVSNQPDNRITSCNLPNNYTMNMNSGLCLNNMSIYRQQI